MVDGGEEGVVMGRAEEEGPGEETLDQPSGPPDNTCSPSDRETGGRVGDEGDEESETEERRTTGTREEGRGQAGVIAYIFN